MQRLFVDTSAWLAHANRKDRHHAPIAKTLTGFPGRLVTSSYVFDETVTLCRARLGHASAARVGDLLRDPRAVDLIRVTREDEDAAWDLFLAREDQSYSFTDCTSFVIMRRLGLATAAALDSDFETEGFRRLPPV